MKKKPMIPKSTNRKVDNLELAAPRLPEDLLGLVSDLTGIEDRARLSLECFQYTRDTYWLECAFADCRKGQLDWDLLCQASLGSTMPPPKSADPSHR
jgi:hypothetical protein